MISCIIKKHYQSPRLQNVSQTSYLKAFHGGEYVKGEWTTDIELAYIFETKTHANSICKLMKLEGLSLINKTI